MSVSVSQLWRNAATGGKRPFFITPQETYTYADLQSAIHRWLALFDRADLADGDRVLIRTQHEFAMTSCFIASILDGKVPVNLASDTPDKRLAAIVRNTEARCLIDDRASGGNNVETWPFVYRVGSEAREGLAGGLISRLRDRSGSKLRDLPATTAAREPQLDEAPDALAYLLYTSGTTQAPSGVMISRSNLLANLDTLSRLFAYDKRSRIFNDMALAHADGMIQGPILALANHAAVIRAGGFSLPNIEEWLHRVRQHRATHVIAVPTIWAMIDSYAAHDDYFDAPELRSLQSVAAKLNSDLWERLERRFGHQIANHYGLTETVASAIYAGPHDEMGPKGTLGKPVDCEARIDPAAGGAGELQLRGANIFPGYWSDRERTLASFTDDGWFCTGDLAERQADGSFVILGRMKNIIMSGGFLIRPEEIDEVMLRHPAVRECATVALEDELFGEIPGTGVVLQEGKAGVTSQELIQHARSELEARKVPKHLIVLDAIPRGISGKAELQTLQAVLLRYVEAGSADDGEAEDSSEIEAKVLALAATVFRLPQEELSLRDGPDEVLGWDSFSHLSLILEAESHFSVRLPAAKVAGISSLADLTKSIRELS